MCRNEWKINFPMFVTFSFSNIVDFVLKIPKFSKNFEDKIDRNSKIKYHKFDFSFVSAHCASLM